MNRPTQAKDVHQKLAEAYNTGDRNRVFEMYDLQGIIVPGPEGPISGKTEFMKAVDNIMSIKGRMEIKTIYCLEVDDIAVGRSEWSIKDGTEIKVAAKGIEVMKRQADGTWKVLIDHAFGAESNHVTL